MFCLRCGKETHEESVMCVRCGYETRPVCKKINLVEETLSGYFSYHFLFLSSERYMPDW